MRALRRIDIADVSTWNHSMGPDEPADPIAYRDDGEGPGIPPQEAKGPWYGRAIEPLASVSINTVERTCTMCGATYDVSVLGRTRFCTTCRRVRDKQIHTKCKRGPRGEQAQSQPQAGREGAGMAGVDDRNR